MPTGQAALVDLTSLDDSVLVDRARTGDSRAVRTLIQRHNRRLYRVARGVVGNDAEAEDVLQDAYLRTFTHIDDFRGEARFSTWVTRIVLNEAVARIRRRRDLVSLNVLDAENGASRVLPLQPSPSPSDPEADAARAQLRRILERAIDDLPDDFRSVFVMRELEEMSVEETASHLGILQATVKTRLHRARRLLRHALEERLTSAVKEAFPFDGPRCSRIADRVLQRLSPDKVSDAP